MAADQMVTVARMGHATATERAHTLVGIITLRRPISEETVVLQAPGAVRGAIAETRHFMVGFPTDRGSKTDRARATILPRAVVYPEIDQSVLVIYRGPVRRPCPRERTFVSCVKALYLRPSTIDPVRAAHERRREHEPQNRDLGIAQPLSADRT